MRNALVLMVLTGCSAPQAGVLESLLLRVDMHVERDAEGVAASPHRRSLDLSRVTLHCGRRAETEYDEASGYRMRLVPALGDVLLFRSDGLWDHDRLGDELESWAVAIATTDGSIEAWWTGSSLESVTVTVLQIDGSLPPLRLNPTSASVVRSREVDGLIVLTLNCDDLAHGAGRWQLILRRVPASIRAGRDSMFGSR